MLSRILEPEVMESPEEARAYNAMDHAEVNRLFTEDFLAVVERSGIVAAGEQPLRVLDAGTGTARIPIEICRRKPAWHMTAVDLAESMLNLGRGNIAAAGLEQNITLQLADAKRLPFPSRGFDAVISNSLVHHLPEPAEMFRELVRLVRPGGVLYVRDLARPEDLSALHRLVELHAGKAEVRQRELFRDSLRAALTVAEVGLMLRGLRLPESWVSTTSDRHWTVSGIFSAEFVHVI